jgi:trk system potassium uptake protein TrkA
MKPFKADKNTQFAVLGLGKFGRSVASYLYENGYNVLCCEQNEEVVQDCAGCATHIVQADASDKAVLEKLGVGNFDVVIIAFGENFEDAAVTATILRELHVPYIMAKAGGPRQRLILKSIGVDRVVLPEKETGERVAHGLITNDLLETIHLSDKYDILEMRPEAGWVGKSLQKLRLRQTEGINIIAILREGEVLAVLDAETELRENDDLIVLKSRR